MTDSAPDISHALHDLSSFQWLHCLGHVINLILQSGLEEPSVSVLLAQCKDVVRYFKKSTVARNKLREQLNEDGFADLTLVQHFNVRWNTATDMFERLIRLYEPVNKVLMAQSRIDLIIEHYKLSHLIALVRFMQPFKRYTEMVSGDTYPTASLMKAVMEKIKLNLQEHDDDVVIVKKIKAMMMTDYRKRHATDTAKEILSITSLLDPRFKNAPYNSTDNVQSYVINKAIELNSQFADDSQTQMESEAQIIENTEGQGLSQINTFFASSSSDTNENQNAIEDSLFCSDDFVYPPPQHRHLETEVRREFENYMAFVVNIDKEKRKQWNPIQWWKVNQFRFPLLSKCARYYLHIPATSVASERIFSLAGNIVTKKRSRLSTDNVNKLIFLHNHRDKLPHDPLPRPGTTDIHIGETISM